MTLMPTVTEPSIEFGLENNEQAKAFQVNLVWEKLDEITLESLFIGSRMLKSLNTGFISICNTYSVKLNRIPP